LAPFGVLMSTDQFLWCSMGVDFSGESQQDCLWERVVHSIRNAGDYGRQHEGALLVKGAATMALP
jgi:hypothetical protein